MRMLVVLGSMSMALLLAKTPLRAQVAPIALVDDGSCRSAYLNVADTASSVSQYLRADADEYVALVRLSLALDHGEGLIRRRGSPAQARLCSQGRVAVLNALGAKLKVRLHELEEEHDRAETFAIEQEVDQVLSTQER